MMTLSHSRRQCDFSRAMISISGSAASAAVTGGETVAVDRQRAAGRQLVGVGRAHHQRVEPAHFGMQQADGVMRRCRRSGTSWSRRVRRSCPVLCTAVARTGRISCSTTGTPARKLPGRLGTREAAADDMNRPQCPHHAAKLGRRHQTDNTAGRTGRGAVLVPVSRELRNFCMLEVVRSAARRGAAMAGYDVEILSVATANPKFRIHPARSGGAREGTLSASSEAVAALRQHRHRRQVQLRTDRVVSQAAYVGGAHRFIS